MKLMWFHLMPYTELPDDFRDKHPSVWVPESTPTGAVFSRGRAVRSRR